MVWKSGIGEGHKSSLPLHLIRFVCSSILPLKCVEWTCGRSPAVALHGVRSRRIEAPQFHNVRCEFRDGNSVNEKSLLKQMFSVFGMPEPRPSPTLLLVVAEFLYV